MDSNFYKDIVFLIAKQSKCVSRQVGAIIVKDGRIISTGYNGTISGYKNCCDVFNKDFNKNEHHEWSKLFEIHAEQNALLIAAKHGISVNNCICYSSLQPCNICLLMLIQAGVNEIYYFEEYEKSVYTDDLLQLIESKKIILNSLK